MSKYAVILDDGTSRMIEASSAKQAMEEIESLSFDGCTEVEDAINAEVPTNLQMTDDAADWLEERAKLAGLTVLRV